MKKDSLNPNPFKNPKIVIFYAIICISIIVVAGCTTTDSEAMDQIKTGRIYEVNYFYGYGITEKTVVTFYDGTQLIIKYIPIVAYSKLLPLEHQNVSITYESNNWVNGNHLKNVTTIPQL